MVEYNIKRFIIAVIFVFLLTAAEYYLIAHTLSGASIGLWSIISTGISATAIITVLFVSWAWKWRIFRGWLVPIPNLTENGKEKSFTKKRERRNQERSPLTSGKPFYPLLSNFPPKKARV